jgi:hypothetical protein
MNKVNMFFKAVTALEKALNAAPDSFGSDYRDDDVRVWTKRSHECDPEDVIQRADGLQETKPKPYGRSGLRKFVFLWRYHPNYCCAGRPHYSWKDQSEFLEKSETEKVLLTYEGYEFVWGWDEISMPTRIVWGMQTGQKMFYLRKDGEVLVRTHVKKHFKEAVDAELGASDEN